MTQPGTAPAGLEFWFEFGSNYSYLAAMRIEGLARAAGVRVLWHPFLLGPVFRELGWSTSPFVLQAAKGRYMWRDMEREAARLGLAWRRPSVFPRTAVLPMRVATLGAEAPWIGEFVRRVMRQNWVEDREIDDAAPVRAALAGLVPDPEAVLAAALAPDNKLRLRATTEQALARGIFGAPTFFVGDEMFWGNDRLEDAIAFALPGPAAAWGTRSNAPTGAGQLVYDSAIFLNTQQAVSMFASGKSARTASSYDWSASALGDPAQWPEPLRLAADLMFNTPLPMLLSWGEQPLVLCNEAYGALAGPGLSRVPGGSVPAVLPPPFAAAGDALARARRGEAACLAGVNVNFGAGSDRFDLYLTPVGAGGALCALAPAAQEQPVAAEEPGTLSILVVEDNLDSQYLVCEMLKAFGYEADGVAHPDDALAHLAARHYHVLFTDVSLPGMSGVDLARQSLERYPHLKVIFASGYGDMLLRHLDFPYQSLQKPYELDQLQDALGKATSALRTGA